MLPKSRIKVLRNRAVNRVVRLAAGFARLLPLALARFLGRGLGRLAHRVLPREREKALRNVATAFPGMDARQRSALVHSTFVHLGRSLLEICWMSRLNASTIPLTTSFDGLDRLREALGRGKGVVLFTGHCGNWEWLAAAMAILGFPVNVIAREMNNEGLRDFTVAIRARHQIRTIERGTPSSAREMLRALRSGAIVAALIDQSIEAENVVVPFFGLPASAPVGPAKLAIRFGAVVMSIFVEYRDGRHWIRLGELVVTKPDDDPAALTARMTAEIEQQIRRVPEQWVWMHERWRAR